jgi:hypothetical protein
VLFGVCWAEILAMPARALHVALILLDGWRAASVTKQSPLGRRGSARDSRLDLS